MEQVPDLFARLVRHDQRIALADGAQTWSYRQLVRQIGAWNDRLDEFGARRVAYRLANGPRWIALDLALLRGGRVAVPIADFFSPAQTAHVLASSGADVYVSDDAECAAPGFTAAGRFDDAMLLRRAVTAPPALHAGTAKITYTSGTTGTPKGVCLSAAHLLSTASAIEAALGHEQIDRHLSVLPLALLLENVAGVYASLGNGSRIDVPPLARLGLTGSSGLDVEKFVASQHHHRPQSLVLVPQLLLALTAAAEFGLTPPDSYRFVAVGGGKVAPSLLERARAAGIPAFEGYGLTECGSVVAVNLPGASRPGSVGRPLPHVKVGIVDQEIRVLGNTMLGYLGEPAAPRCIATGDLGHVDRDGFVHVSGRRKSGFITAYGRNVSPEWIESELTAEIAIAQALVFGEALPANVGLIVPRGGADADAVGQAVAAANQRLPDYARLARWTLVSADTFSAAGCLTDNGRPRRAAAAAYFRDALQQLTATQEDDPHAAIRRAGTAHP